MFLGWFRWICTVSAGVAAASAKPLLAVGAGVASWAVAAVAARALLHAGPSVKTRPVCACHGTDFTVLSVEALRARTRIIVQQILERRKEREYEEHGWTLQGHSSARGLHPLAKKE